MDTNIHSSMDGSSTYSLTSHAVYITPCTHPVGENEGGHDVVVRIELPCHTHCDLAEVV
mgnify:CR=1 FL=1